LSAAEESVGAYLAEHSAHCPECGLQLAGCGGESCPSCGRTLTVEELRRTSGAVVESPTVIERGCPQCGYELLGLPTDVCPECGCDMTIKVVEFTSTRTASATSARRFQKASVAVLGTCLVGGIVAPASLLFGRMAVGGTTNDVVLGALGVTVAASAVTAWWLYTRAGNGNARGR
jgi:hypothetical protein